MKTLAYEWVEGLNTLTPMYCRVTYEPLSKILKGYCKFGKYKEWEESTVFTMSGIYVKVDNKKRPHYDRCTTKTYALTCPKSCAPMEAYLNDLMQHHPNSNLRYSIPKYLQLTDEVSPQLLDMMIWCRNVPEVETILSAPQGQKLFWLMTPKFLEKSSHRVLVEYVKTWTSLKNGFRLFLDKYPMYVTSLKDLRPVTPTMKVYGRITYQDLQWIDRHLPDIEETRQGNYKAILDKYDEFLRYREIEATDMQEDYWRHPSRWYEIYQYYEEHKEEMEAKHNPALITEFQARYKKWDSQSMQKGELCVRSYSDINEWKVQAHELYQCIIACRYYAKKSSRLLFVRDTNNTPLSTFEIGIKSNKILQSYANERDRHNLKPAQEHRELVEAFIEKYMQ